MLYWDFLPGFGERSRESIDSHLTANLFPIIPMSESRASYTMRSESRSSYSESGGGGGGGDDNGCARLVGCVVLLGLLGLAGWGGWKLLSWMFGW